MAKKVRDIMSKSLIKLDARSSVLDAARKMAGEDVGALVVEDSGKLCGIVTDRDIVVRAIATGKGPDQTALQEICSKDPLTLAPDDELDRAVALMRDKKVRRVPVVDSSGKTVGMLSLGDLAIERDLKSVLGQISSAPPTH